MGIVPHRRLHYPKAGHAVSSVRFDICHKLACRRSMLIVNTHRVRSVSSMMVDVSINLRQTYSDIDLGFSLTLS